VVIITVTFWILTPFMGLRGKKGTQPRAIPRGRAFLT
jgi:hypothetical protein